MFNFRKILTNAKHAITVFETRVETGITSILLSSTSIVDEFAHWLQNTGAPEEQLLIDSLESPLAKKIASLLPNGDTYLNEIIAVLNRVAPYMKNAVNEATVFDGAMHHLAAEITSILHGGKLTADEYINQVQQLFLPVPPTE